MEQTVAEALRIEPMVQQPSGDYGDCLVIKSLMSSVASGHLGSTHRTLPPFQRVGWVALTWSSFNLNYYYFSFNKFRESETYRRFFLLFNNDTKWSTEILCLREPDTGWGAQRGAEVHAAVGVTTVTKVAAMPQHKQMSRFPAVSVTLSSMLPSQSVCKTCIPFHRRAPAGAVLDFLPVAMALL